MDKIDFVNSTQPALNDTNLNLMQDNIERAINAQVSGDTLPIGTLLPFTSTTTPANWLLCDGREISRTTYSQLYNVIGTRYGVGDGSTTFNLPDLRGRVPVGYDSSQTEFNSTGKTGGEKTVTLTENQIPSHRHTGTSGDWGTSSGQYGVLSNYAGTGNSVYTGYTGGGQAHNNLQPYIVSRYIIKAFQTAGTVAQIVNTKTTSSVNAYSATYINNLHSYSTTEKVVGTWIDGKPLYRKVITTATTSQETTYNISSIPFDYLKMDGRIILNPNTSNEYRVEPYYINSTDYVRNPFMKTNNKLIALNSSHPEGQKRTWIIILEYTKTTD